MQKRQKRAGFSLIELLVVVGIILFITALALPNFVALFKSQGVAKCARMVQTAVLQTRNRAISLGRQQKIQFLNDYQAPNGSQASVIVVTDGGEDWDGNGDPFTSASPLGWENSDEKIIETLVLPKGFTWGAGKVVNVVSGTPAGTFPVVICMPDGSLKIYSDPGGTYAAWTNYQVASTGQFNVSVSTNPTATSNVQGNHELEVLGRGEVYYVHFIKPTGRVKIKGES